MHNGRYADALETKQMINRLPAGVPCTYVQAACSGMDCAVMSGGDVGPLGKDAVTELHGLFRWAAKSPRCVMGGGNGAWYREKQSRRYR